MLTDGGAQGPRAAERPVDRDRGVRADRQRRSDLLREDATCSDPTRAARRPTACCARRWRRPGKGAVAKFSTRGRQQLVLLREAQGGLMMHALFYADEVRDFAEIDRGESVDAQAGRARSRRAAHRAARLASVRPDEVRRRVPQAGPRADRAEGRRPGDRRRARPQAPKGTDHRSDGGAEGEPGVRKARAGDGGASARRRASRRAPRARPTSRHRARAQEASEPGRRRTPRGVGAAGAIARELRRRSAPPTSPACSASPPARVRAMVRAGWCRPGRAGRGVRASTSRTSSCCAPRIGLRQARVPARRVQRALRELLRQLPADRPLSGVRIFADGGRVVVRERRPRLAAGERSAAVRLHRRRAGAARQRRAASPPRAAPRPRRRPGRGESADRVVRARRGARGRRRRGGARRLRARR